MVIPLPRVSQAIPSLQVQGHILEILILVALITEDSSLRVTLLQAISRSPFLAALVPRKEVNDVNRKAKARTFRTMTSETPTDYGTSSMVEYDISGFASGQGSLIL